eukprot:maker-scaffold911_size81771-snap-gene-0.22 protein:Tk03750 transcript:maker-scaffold911_size81771-snap-gene-0.22-mRNA-1 annotation:"Aladin"
MASSSLWEFPPLSATPSARVCEYDSVLLGQAALFPPHALRGWAWLEALMPDDRDSGGLGPSQAGSGLEQSFHLSLKHAFLPRSRERQLQVGHALAQWFDEGLFSALESLTTTSEGRFTSFWAKGVESVARTLLALYRMTSNIHSSFNPHLMLSGDDMIAKFSQNTDWFNSPVRALAWHPHVAKLAVVLRSDVIHISGRDLPSSPVLKYKSQKGVACLAWRPLNGSELAVGCLTGLLVWNVDPLSVAAHPSASCVTILPTPPGHAPVTSLQWDPKGNLLLSSSAADTSMILWNTASETKIPLRRVGGGGVHMVLWSPDASKVFAATPSTSFRVWDTIHQWTHERWNVLGGHVNSACWSPCGQYLLFTTNEEPLMFCLNFHPVDGSSAAAVPVADLTNIEVEVNHQIKTVGGLVQSMKWDPMGERLALSFQKSDVIALFATTLSPVLSLSPIGLIQGLDGETPMVVEFAQQCNEGSLLTVAWSSGRLQHIPLFYVPAIDRNSAPLVINPDFEALSGFQGRLPSGHGIWGQFVGIGAFEAHNGFAQILAAGGLIRIVELLVWTRTMSIKTWTGQATKDVLAVALAHFMARGDLGEDIAQLEATHTRENGP